MAKPTQKIPFIIIFALLFSCGKAGGDGKDHKTDQPVGETNKSIPNPAGVVTTGATCEAPSAIPRSAIIAAKSGYTKEHKEHEVRPNDCKGMSCLLVDAIAANCSEATLAPVRDLSAAEGVPLLRDIDYSMKVKANASEVRSGILLDIPYGNAYVRNLTPSYSFMIPKAYDRHREKKYPLFINPVNITNTNEVGSGYLSVASDSSPEPWFVARFNFLNLVYQNQPHSFYEANWLDYQLRNDWYRAANVMISNLLRFYNIDPERIYIGGTSSEGLHAKFLTTELNSTFSASNLVSVYAPSQGSFFKERQDFANILMVLGGKDEIVSRNKALDQADLLRSLGVNITVWDYPSEGQGTMYDSEQKKIFEYLNNTSRLWPTTIRKVILFEDFADSYWFRASALQTPLCLSRLSRDESDVPASFEATKAIVDGVTTVNLELQNIKTFEIGLSESEVRDFDAGKFVVKNQGGDVSVAINRSIIPALTSYCRHSDVNQLWYGSLTGSP